MDGSLSIYCLSAFGRYLESETLASAIAALGSRFKDGLAFECMCPVTACGSDTLCFLPQGQMPSTVSTTYSMRSQVLASFRDNSYNAGINTDLVPSDFYLLERTGVAAINDFMDKACAVSVSYTHLDVYKRQRQER